jgi:hypothetical protein
LSFIAGKHCICSIFLNELTMKKIFILLSILSISISVYAQIDVVISGNSTPGSKIQIKNDDNNNNALTAITEGSGAGLFGSNMATTGIVIGIRGTSRSTSNGSITAGVSGVYGHITSTLSGGNSAGVRGVNNGTGYTGAGVIGYQAGSGRGVYGETPGGFGVYGFTSNSDDVGVGVRGETMAKYGAGVEAIYSGVGTGTALEIGNGAIRVTGNNRTAFVHTATIATKVTLNGTIIDNAMCNGDPNCILFVTQRLGNNIADNSPLGVFYDTSRQKWGIFNQNLTEVPTNTQFNILVIKQE